MSLQEALFGDGAKTIYYCVQCRQEPETKPALRCSRCKVVHYCSRDCQKTNFPLHKAWCKQIDKSRKMVASLMDEQENSGVDAPKQHADGKQQQQQQQQQESEMQQKIKTHQYHLAHTILELGYRSTDTMDRGKTIYGCALLEFYKLMRLDPFAIGACESVLLLLAMLGYDDYCMTMIHFLLYPPGLKSKQSDATTKTDREEAIRQHVAAASEEPSDAWIFGEPSKKAGLLLEYGKIRDMVPSYWGSNNFLVPLMLIKMRQQCRLRQVPTELKEETVTISREVEHAADFLLPVLLSLFPDSRQRWGQEEVCTLLAHVDYKKLHDHADSADDDSIDDEPYKPNVWEQHCITFWMMFKDCYAFTPGLLDVLEETAQAMRTMGVGPIPEDPPRCTNSR